MRHALEDADQNTTSISEIAFACGFSDAAHFSRRFKARFGCSPSDYGSRAKAGASVGAAASSVADSSVVTRPNG